MSDTEDTPNVDEPTTVDNAEAPDEPQPEAGETYPPDTDSESDTFPRYYVERRRRESAG